MRLEDLRIKIFADGADLASMIELAKRPHIKGFTTNPTLMRKAGITDYADFAKKVLSAVPDKPISFEVFADDFTEMERQARIIASWGPNVYVKIPITNTLREFSLETIQRLTSEGVKVNVTALLTFEQVCHITYAFSLSTPGIVSVFAGRVADTGVDPRPLMAAAKRFLDEHHPNLELLWASPRQVLDIIRADQAGCHIVTVTPDLLAKLALLGKDLAQYSLETVQMFHNDGQAAGFKL